MSEEVGTDQGAGAGEACTEMILSVPDPETLKLIEVPAGFDDRHIRAAWALSEGRSKVESAKLAGVSKRTLYHWLNELPGFRGVVDSLTMLTGLSSRAERMRTIKRLAMAAESAGLPVSLKRHDLVDLVRLGGELVEGPSRTVGGLAVVAQYAAFYLEGKSGAVPGGLIVEGQSKDRIAGAQLAKGSNDGEENE